ncbi:MOSC domain-containing protein [Phototrophicus methaneseepsis]|uniref:MOSC domain-containing protein n=1 Tax=Phototrophicus methaneseepsis TaxID=2710758 RepID=A0A7S8E5F3_9CHLR|nr:MOSC domain-containing protein [Phototrophicus methaneseepsis]QPC80680.1 MOSC domain-containing protein [Phototrophicus methaneseepsis]
MKLVSINIGKEQAITGAKSYGVTGIYKQPQTDTVTVTPLGLEGDTISDTENHGGPDQAIYVYTLPDYGWWEQELGRQLAPGTFGENLTLSEGISNRMTIGDRIHIGDVVLEVTDARIPCVTLAVRMGDPTFVKRFTQAERPGAYCRVIVPGQIKINADVQIEPATHSQFTILDSFRLFYNKKATPADLQRALDTPISIRGRHDIQKRLDAMSGD